MNCSYLLYSARCTIHFCHTFDPFTCYTCCNTCCINSTIHFCHTFDPHTLILVATPAASTAATVQNTLPHCCHTYLSHLWSNIITCCIVYTIFCPQLLTYSCWVDLETVEWLPHPDNVSYQSINAIAELSRWETIYCISLKKRCLLFQNTNTVQYINYLCLGRSRGGGVQRPSGPPLLPH